MGIDSLFLNGIVNVKVVVQYETWADAGAH
jgi:hypothetical protein